MFDFNQPIVSGCVFLARITFSLVPRAIRHGYPSQGRSPVELRDSNLDSFQIGVCQISVEQLCSPENGTAQVKALIRVFPLRKYALLGVEWGHRPNWETAQQTWKEMDHEKPKLVTRRLLWQVEPV
jgi:hypothetical protein